MLGVSLPGYQNIFGSDSDVIQFSADAIILINEKCDKTAFSGHAICSMEFSRSLLPSIVVNLPHNPHSHKMHCIVWSIG